MLSSGVLPTLALIGSLLVSVTDATPVTPSKCVTYEKGTLKTAELTGSDGIFNGQHKPFAFNYRGELSFYHQTPHPTISVEFQTCTPNYASNDNRDMDKVGRIYIPSTKQCLAVNNASGNGPYHVTAQGCPNSSAGEMVTTKSIPFNWVNSRGYTSWVGASNQNNTRLQGGCPGGQWGFKADDTRTPITNKAGEYRVDLVCSRNTTASQFWIS